MSKYPDIEQFETHLETLGLAPTLLQTAPATTLSEGETLVTERVQQSLHTLPEMRLADSAESGDDVALRLLSTLGEGGMGVVRLANQVALDREVAVKTIRPDRSRDVAQALLQEAYVTGYLEHPNIIPIYTVGKTVDGLPLIVMKCIEGTSWDEQLQRTAGQWPPEDLERHIDILIQVTNAVRFAHSRQVLHRDIKLDNVMIGDFDEVYLVDWGIAVCLDDTKSRLPTPEQSTGISGTPAYMAPEMAHQRIDEIDERTDVYLLGATLHHILTGEPRHQGEKMLDVLFSANLSEPYDYSDDVPDELARIANKACHADSDQRFSSATAFRDALRQFQKHRESVAISASATDKLAKLKAQAQADEPDVSAVHDTYGECRFGFLEALRMWSDNAVATRGLQHCLETMADFHLRQDSVDAARACIAELPEPRPQLVERADALAGRLDEKQQDLARLKEMERDLDLDMASTSRSVVMIILGVVWTATSLYGAITLGSGDVAHHEELRHHMTSGLRNLAIIAAVSFIFRKHIFANTANKRLVYTLFSAMILVAFLRWSVWFLDDSLFLARNAEALIFAIVLVVIGLISDLRICVLSLAFVAMVAVSLVWPELQIYASTAAVASTFAGFAWLWSPSQINNKITL